MGDGGTSDRGGGGELRLVHRAWCFGWIFLNFFSRLFSSVLLRAGGSVKDLAAWSSPPPLKSLCCAHSCTVHITSPAPSSSPTHPPTANDSRARPLHEATAFSTSCTYTHMHTNLAHACARARTRETSSTCTDQRAQHIPFPPSWFLPLHFFSYRSVSSPSPHPEKNPLAL